MENKYLENKNIIKKKKTFKEKKDNTLASLSEVEYFLTNFKKCSKYIKLYKIIK